MFALLHIDLVHGCYLNLLHFVGQGAISVHGKFEESLLNTDCELFHSLVTVGADFEQLGCLKERICY